MNEFINLEDAVIRLNAAGQQASVQQIIEGDPKKWHLLLFWRNSRQVFSRVIVPDGREDAGMGCVPARLLQISFFDRDRLESEEAIETRSFELLDEDLPQLVAQGLDHLDLMRWADELCVVTRASLRVRAADVDSLVAGVLGSDTRIQKAPVPQEARVLVKQQVVANVFPDKRWPSYFKNANRNGLGDAARVSHGLYDLVKAGMWLVAHAPRADRTPCWVLRTAQNWGSAPCSGTDTKDKQAPSPFDQAHLQCATQ